MRVLIAEDEVSIARALKLVLERNNYTVDMIHNGLEALDYLKSYHYDAIVLDIMMPGLDGLEVLKRARSAGIFAPALFLTAKSEVEDRVIGLDAGADDYLSKPFAMSEFLARVKALARRSYCYVPDLMCLGNTRLDGNQYTLTAQENSVRLNNKEFQLMELFMRYPHHVFSSDVLMDRIWGIDAQSSIDVVWTYIGFLRKKIKQLGADIEIRTIRGAGYSLEEM